MTYKAYTDYPVFFEAISQEDRGLVREVEVLSYDRNKYFTVMYRGFETEVKTGYIFQDPGRKRHFTPRMCYALPDSPEGKCRTHHQIANEAKKERRRKTSYRVISASKDATETNRRKDFKNYHEALRYSQSQCMLGTHNVSLHQDSQIKNCWQDKPLMEMWDSNVPTVYVGRGRKSSKHSIRSNVYRKYFYPVWQHLSNTTARP